MITYKNLYDKCLDKQFIKEMIKEAAKHKRKKRADIEMILENLDSYAEVIHDMLESQSYSARPPRKAKINEGSKQKTRTISKVRFCDQVIQHIAVKTCWDVFNKGMYEYCCGSVPGRGIHHAKRYIARWIRDDHKNTKYCCQMDIKHYFESVDKEILKAMLRRRIADTRMVWLLEEIIDSCENGIPLGYYTSQWFANFLLQGLDHYIKEKLHVKYYVRYMDDMVIMGRNKKELHKARAAIEEYLQSNLNLQMKGNYQVFRMEYMDRSGKSRGRALDFMGFRFFRDRTILRKSLMFRICRKAARVGRKDRPTFYDSAVMLSYLGWIKSSQTYHMYEARIKPYANAKQMKGIVSKKAKEGKKSAKNRLEKCHRDTGKKAGTGGHNQQPDNGLHSQECEACPG